jgi:hypothetical protein
MDKLPFSVYDFFGYLASGFLVLVGAEFAFNGQWLLRKDLNIPQGIFWVVAAYIAGHIIANISGFLLEGQLVRKVLRSPEESLFGDEKQGFWCLIFPGFYIPLPEETCARILRKSEAKAGIKACGRGLFFHCHPIVKRDANTLARLNTFLNLYGFCRNVSMASIIVVGMLLIGLLRDWQLRLPFQSAKLWWAVAATVGALGMFYRYLKFFRQYTVEVFVTYAETD